MSDFFAFNINAISYFTYLLVSNIGFFLLAIGAVGTVFLRLKEEIDASVREEQNII